MKYGKVEMVFHCIAESDLKLDASEQMFSLKVRDQDTLQALRETPCAHTDHHLFL